MKYKMSNKKNILLIGDVIIDNFQYGNAIGISAETPTVVAKYRNKETEIGGVGLVRRHLELIDLVNTEVVTITSSTDPNFTLSKEFNKYSFFFLGDWRISTKSRYFVDGYKMVQYDEINESIHTSNSEKHFLDFLIPKLIKSDIVVISDNRHGVMNEFIAKSLVSLQNHFNYDLYVDSQMSQKNSNHSWYAGCHTMFVNERERDFIIDNVSKVPTYDLCKNFIVKLGKNGCVGNIGNMKYKINGNAINVVDTCGAGDAFLASYVSNYNEFDIENVLIKANNYASWMCTIKGTSTPSREEYLKWSKT